MIEKVIQKAIVEYLTYRRVFHWRNNSGAMISEYKGKTRMMRFGAVGSPDIFALKGGILYGIEVKTTKGTQSDHQIEFQKNMETHGGIYFVARSIDDVQAKGL